MAEYDWLTSDEFRERIRQRVSQAAGQAGMQQYHVSIIENLMSKAAEKRQVNESNELRKSLGSRRSIDDALASVEALAKAASEYATAEKRTLLTEADVDKAYVAGFCRWWPLC
jgi:DNA-binding SARP family transcriptional activator